MQCGLVFTPGSRIKTMVEDRIANTNKFLLSRWSFDSPNWIPVNFIPSRNDINFFLSYFCVVQIYAKNFDRVKTGIRFTHKSPEAELPLNGGREKWETYKKTFDIRCSNALVRKTCSFLFKHFVVTLWCSGTLKKLNFCHPKNISFHCCTKDAKNSSRKICFFSFFFLFFFD